MAEPKDTLWELCVSCRQATMSWKDRNWACVIGQPPVASRPASAMVPLLLSSTCTHTAMRTFCLRQTM
jgi:hypothetical protein